MAKKRIIISDNDVEKKKTSKTSVDSKLVKRIIVAVLVLAVITFAVVKVVNYTNNYIGTVDGRKIYVWEFDSYLQQVEYEMTQDLSDEVEIEAFWGQVVDGKTNRQIAKETALDRLIEQKVKISKAAELGIEIDNVQLKKIIDSVDAEVDYAINQYKQYGLEYTREEFAKSAYGLEYSKLKEQRANDWITNKLDNVEKSKIIPTDEQIRKWYEDNKDKYDYFETSRIFISFTDDEDELLEGEDLTKKQDLVKEVESKLEAGEKVSEIAGQYTENESETNGYYNFRKDKADEDEINEWIEDAEVGDYTKIELKDSDDKVIGVYFIQYDGMITIDTPDNKYARDIESEVKAEVVEDIYKQKVEEWKKESQFEVKFNKDIYEKYKVAGMPA